MSPPPEFTLPHRTVYAGTFIHLGSRTELCIREHAILGVSLEGRIEFVRGRGEERALTEEWIEHEVRRVGWGGRMRGNGKEEGVRVEEEGGEEEEEEVMRGGRERGGRGRGKGWVLVWAQKGEFWFPGFVGEFFILLFLVC